MQIFILCAGNFIIEILMPSFYDFNTSTIIGKNLFNLIGVCSL